MEKERKEIFLFSVDNFWVCVTLSICNEGKKYDLRKKN